MSSTRVRGAALVGIVGLALGAIFGLAPAASAVPAGSAASSGLFGPTARSTLGMLGETVGGLTERAAHHRHHSRIGHRHDERHAHAAFGRHDHADHQRVIHARAVHPRAVHRLAAGHQARHHSSRPAHHREITAATAYRLPIPQADLVPRADSEVAAAYDTSGTPPQQSTGLLGGLLGGTTSLVNGVLSGVTGVLGGATHAVGHLLGGNQPANSQGHTRPTPPSKTGAPAPPRPPATTHAGPSGPSGLSGPSGPSGNSLPAQPNGSFARTHGGAGAQSSPHHTLSGRALPAPSTVPSLISPPSHTAAPTNRPVVEPASTSPQALRPVVPVSMTSAPSGWVLFLAVGLFAVAVMFMVLGAGYRGRRAR